MAKKQRTTRKRSRRDCPLCAVDIGSSGIRAMAATENPDGTLHVLGMESVNKYGPVERGIVNQKSEAGMMLSRLLKFLANRIGSQEPIESAYLTVGGKLLQLKEVSVKRDLISKNYIPDKLLESMQEECKTKIEDKYNMMAVLSTEPIKYLLDGVEQSEVPSRSQKARFIEIVYNVFVGRIESRENVRGSFDRANISIEQQWVRPDALLSALVDENDMARGCAIIDFGAQTTTMSIYKNDRFIYTRVIPLGGYDISTNIQTQGVSFDIAEKLKETYGYASEEYVEQNRVLEVRSNTGGESRVRIKTSTLAQLIQMKLYEAVDPLMQDLKNYEDEISKVYITGGACKLQGLQEYLQAMTGLPVEYGSHALWLEDTAPDEYFYPDYSALVGTLALAVEYRKDFPDEEPAHPAPITRIWEKIEDGALSLFTEDNNK